MEDKDHYEFPVESALENEPVPKAITLLNFRYHSTHKELPASEGAPPFVVSWVFLAHS